jgi:hypothetical protein
MSIAELLGTKRRAATGNPRVRRGDYFCSSRQLYCVEQVASERALVEDCATGDLIDVALGELLALRRVRRDRR